ncbi:hypothetical protein ACR3K2_14660 [Cryptosporidium serpentis]
MTKVVLTITDSWVFKKRSSNLNCGIDKHCNVYALEKYEPELETKKENNDEEYSGYSHSYTKDRFSGCFTIVYSTSSSQSNTTSYEDFNISNENTFDNNEYVWQIIIGIGKKVTSIFWSIVSLDDDIPLYDYSIPIVNEVDSEHYTVQRK